MNKIYTEDFTRAVEDYHYLMKRDYPQKATLKIIGDRYRLGKLQRTILYRGIYCRALSRERKRRLTGRIRGQAIHIDCYNVVLTISSYLQGFPLYIGTDNLLRDAAESHGRAINNELFYKALGQLLDYGAKERAETLNFYIDSPVSHSGKLARYINEELVRRGLKGKAQTVKSADYELIKVERGLVATSDSIIVSKAPVKTVDLARQVLKSRYNPNFIKLKSLL